MSATTSNAENENRHPSTGTFAEPAAAGPRPARPAGHGIGWWSLYAPAGVLLVPPRQSAGPGRRGTSLPGGVRGGGRAHRQLPQGGAGRHLPRLAADDHAEQGSATISRREGPGRPVGRAGPTAWGGGWPGLPAPVPEEVPTEAAAEQAPVSGRALELIPRRVSRSAPGRAFLADEPWRADPPGTSGPSWGMTSGAGCAWPSRACSSVFRAELGGPARIAVGDERRGDAQQRKMKQ